MTCRLCLVLLVLGLSSPLVAAPAAIQFDMGQYPSAAAASDAEAEINWSDADLTDDARCTLGFAALELRRHLCPLVGLDAADTTQFPIVPLDEEVNGDRIVIACRELGVPKPVLAAAGLTKEAVADLGPEDFRIKTGPGTLLIYGGGRVGALYGVYEVLDRLGVRWFGPEAHDTEIPRVAWNGLPKLDIRDGPAFVTRGFWAWERRGNPYFFDWMARNRMNLWTDAESNHPALKKRGIQLLCGGHLHQSRFLNPRSPYPYDVAQFEADDNKPPDPYPPGHYQGDVNGDGVLSYFEVHPEWYGLHGGKRSDNIHGDAGDNYCTSNPSATAELLRNIIQDLTDGTWRDADSINFWMLDGGRWCECDDCKALGTPTDRLLLLVHALRQEIRKAQKEGRLHRNIKIYFCAYAETINPPTRPLPDDFDYENCIATYYPIRRCYVHTIDDPKCTEFNVGYQKHFLEWTTDPNRLYRGQMFIGEYYNVSGFKCLPINFWRTMAHDIAYYYDHGARHFDYMHCTTRKWGTKALTNWELARLLWNPHRDEQALLDDYFNGRYGPAADTMREVYAQMDTALCNVRVLKYDLAPRISRNEKALFARKHMKYEETHTQTDDGPDFRQMLSAVERASTKLRAALARDLPERVRKRLAEDLYPIEYARATLHFYDEVMNCMWAQRKGDQKSARRRFRHAAIWQKALEAMVEPVSYSSSHGSAPNAFVASYIVPAWHRLLAQFGEGGGGKVAVLEGKGPLRVDGSGFAGGGALLYGHRLNIGGILSEHANYVYAASNPPYDVMSLRVKIPRPPRGLRLTVVGTIAPRGDEPVPIEILWNETRIFAGPAPFPAVKLAPHQFTVPQEALKEGENKLTIRCTVPNGPTGNRPWFGVDRVEIKAL